MKELKGEAPIIQTHYPTKRKVYPRKRWIIAQSSSSYRTKAIANRCLEASYHEVIKSVKQFMQPNEQYYERDLKTDNESGFMAMHSFMCATFYWRLDCNLLYDYEVRFQFQNCAFESEIRKMFRAYPLDRMTIEAPFKVPLATVFARLLADEPQFILTI
ncbi:MAG TPA: hypothetical protein VNW51_00070 [Mucilaginibacter sp.]|jgi:hypothetical protein|nr:hypothetical protein [Mucilaginibacter sp.]